MRDLHDNHWDEAPYSPARDKSDSASSGVRTRVAPPYEDADADATGWIRFAFKKLSRYAFIAPRRGHLTQ
jgi:hypothetical protein